MTSENSIDTETLVASLGQTRRWVLPTGVMQELIRRGPEVMPALIAPIEKAIDSRNEGLGSLPEESFFCYQLLGIDPNPSLRGLLDRLFRCEDDRLDLVTGEITNGFSRALMSAMADPNDIMSHYEWVESLVQDPKVNIYAKLKAVDSLINLAAQGVIPKETVFTGAQTWLEQRANEKEDPLSAFLVCSLLDTGSPAVRDIAQPAFDRNQIDTMIVGVGSFHELDSEHEWEVVADRAKDDQEILTDPIGFLSKWHAFGWETREILLRDVAYQRIYQPNAWKPEKVSAENIASALDALETASFDVYPKEALTELNRHCSEAIPQLTQWVRFGVEAANRGESMSHYAPSIAAMLLAINSNEESMLFDDSNLFLDVLDLPAACRHDWFGDTIDGYLIAALANMLRGETEPIERRVMDEERSDVLRAELIHYFPIAVYQGCLSRERCLEVLHSLAEKWFVADNEETPGLVIDAVYESLCMMSVPDDSSVIQKAKAAGVTINLLSRTSVERLVSTPEDARKIMREQVLPSHKIQTAMEESCQYSHDAIHPPPLNIESEVLVGAPANTASKTIRVDGPRVGRNAPCPCGSGKKRKKCCGRS